jgi:hypothetical protein
MDCSINAHCLSALSYSYLGVKHSDLAIIQDGLKKCGRSLSVLNGTLAKSQVTICLDFLESIIIMETMKVSLR